jgi:hypothetical protein
MNYDYLTNEELIRHVKNLPLPTSLELLLADRLVSVQSGINAKLETLKGVPHEQLTLDFTHEVPGFRNVEPEQPS